MKNISVFFLFLILLFIPLILNAQDFGFGDSDFGFSSESSSFSVHIGGEANAGLTLYFDDFSSAEKIRESKLGDIFSGSLNFEAGNSAAQGIINLNLAPVLDSPVEIDEAYLRTYFGSLTFEGGYRKIYWGRADSFGPLDLINPLDFQDLTRISDPQSIKIARPMIRGIWSISNFSRLDAVFIPWYQGHQFAVTGRWAPSQIKTLQESFIIDELYPETNSLEYAQTGLRFTTSFLSSDMGFQYYFGRLPRPAVNWHINPALQTPIPLINYNHYHHIGLDFARVIYNFNIRAEAGANITGDLDGTDGNIENPCLLWSLGFDRDLFLGINMNLQGAGSYRLYHDNIGANPFTDIEAGTEKSSTRITGIFSKNFFRDELEIKVTGLWGIEDRDFLIMPGILWSANSVSAELSAGFFGGSRKGELGQYRDNCYVKAVLGYRF